MDQEFVVEGGEQSEVFELTLEEMEAVSGGCGPRCCVDQKCSCGG